MKALVLSFLALLLFSSSAAAQEGKHIPIGIREADKATEQADRNIPPPLIQARSKSPDLQQEAEELARLAQSIPADLEQVNHGVLPKDLNNKLKRIEKLSKRLRNDLAP
jgi:Skp family chaperone for outer membrane proteins